MSKDLTSSVDYEDSVNELDAAFDELKSNPHFPQVKSFLHTYYVSGLFARCLFSWNTFLLCFKQGLARLSGSTLGRARDLLLERLIHTLPLRESQLKAIVNASVEMDFSKLKRIDNDCIDFYLEKLMRITSNGLNLSESKDFMEDSRYPSADAVPSAKHDNWVDGDCSVSVIEQLGRRQLAVSHSSAVETGLENLWRTLGQSMNHVPGNTSNAEMRKHSACLLFNFLNV